MTLASRSTGMAFRRMAALLGLVAVLLRCAIAPGVMPDPLAAANGAWKLVICTGTGLKVLPGNPFDAPSPADHHGADALCPYSAAGYLAVTSDLSPFTAPPVLAAFEARAGNAVVRGVPLLPFAARAPPRLA
jgi:hypothetical protein